METLNMFHFFFNILFKKIRYLLLDYVVVWYVMRDAADKALLFSFSYSLENSQYSMPF